MGDSDPKHDTERQSVSDSQYITESWTNSTSITSQCQSPSPPMIQHDRPHSNQSRINNNFLYHTHHQHNHDTHGEFPHKSKPTHHFRFLYSNINGISINNYDQDTHQIGHTSEEYQVNYLGLVETNIHWQHLALNKNIRTILQKYWQQSIITTSSTPKVTPG